MYPGIKKLFPKAEFDEIDAGHWYCASFFKRKLIAIRVHAEQPELFMNSVQKFIL